MRSCHSVFFGKIDVKRRSLSDLHLELCVEAPWRPEGEADVPPPFRTDAVTEV